MRMSDWSSDVYSSDLQTLSNLIDHRSSRTEKIGSHDTRTLKEHLTSIPSDGTIRIRLNISRTSATSLDEVKDLLSRQLDSKLTVADALSFLLFDYVAEQKAAQVMGKLGLSGPDPFGRNGFRSEEHTSELQSLMRISYAVFCLKKKKNNTKQS